MQPTTEIERPPATSEPGRIGAALIARIGASPVEHDPCDHVRLERIFDADTLRQLIENLPDEDQYEEQIHKDALLPDGRYARLRFELTETNIAKLPEPKRSFWQAVLDDVRSPQIERAYKEKFRAALTQRFGRDAMEVRTVQRPVLFRDIAGYKISVHADNLDKVITSQIYLPRDDTQAHLGTSFHRRRADRSFETVRTLPFLPNSGYAFPVTTQSWHSVAQMRESDGARNSLMLIWYLEEKPSKLQKLVTRLLATSRGARSGGNDVGQG